MKGWCHHQSEIEKECETSLKSRSFYEKQADVLMKSGVWCVSTLYLFLASYSKKK